jgi:hypothetical protein
MAEFQIRFVTQESFAEVTALLEAQLFEHQMSPPTDSLRQAIRSVIDNPRYGFILLAAGPDGSMPPTNEQSRYISDTIFFHTPGAGFIARYRNEMRPERRRGAGLTASAVESLA